MFFSVKDSSLKRPVTSLPGYNAAFTHQGVHSGSPRLHDQITLNCESMQYPHS